LSVTNRAWAISGLLIPVAASSATRRSLVVSASSPVNAPLRGLAPAASSSSLARCVSRVAPQR
jgi:hypothetical protein